MCGIAGIVTSPAWESNLAKTIERMVDAMRHRGPDGSGTAIFPSRGVAIGMRRLTIIDLLGGRQPMRNEDGRYHVVFNGEIYNAPHLRTELLAQGHVFVSDHSDTEVIVHGFEQWAHELFPRLNGMFAIAVYDDWTGTVTLARDRMGEKPLYVARVPGGFAFASEMKAILRHPGVSKEIDPVAMEQYLGLDYILGPQTILRQVSKVPAGHWATLKDGQYSTQSYWCPSTEKLPLCDDDLVERFDELMDNAVAFRLQADVPLGLFLSGGLDSTAVGHYMRRHVNNLESFSIGYEHPDYDESRFASMAAEHLGTKHHLEIFSQDRIKSLVPEIATILDEPMGDQSIFPTFLLSLAASRRVKVVLSGDGSDEMLMGYHGFRPLQAAWMLDRLNPACGRVGATLARKLPDHLRSTDLKRVRFVQNLDRSPVQRMLANLGSLRGTPRWLLSEETREHLNGALLHSAEARLMKELPLGLDAADQSILAYVRGYLQEDVLVKLDRASMAASLEVRAPFLDPDLVDFMLAVPSRMKMKKGTGKYLLRRAMRGRIPDEIIDRPKLGFGVPVNAWLRESLRPVVEECLARDRVRAQGLFDPDAVDSVVRDHLSGARDRGHQLWLLVAFQLWHERWLERENP
jgi:asparagine synthase (glutamine-hydrolysing)